MKLTITTRMSHGTVKSSTRGVQINLQVTEKIDDTNEEFSAMQKIIGIIKSDLEEAGYKPYFRPRIKNRMTQEQERTPPLVSGEKVKDGNKDPVVIALKARLIQAETSAKNWRNQYEELKMKVYGV